MDETRARLGHVGETLPDGYHAARERRTPLAPAARLNVVDAESRCRRVEDSYDVKELAEQT